MSLLRPARAVTVLALLGSAAAVALSRSSPPAPPLEVPARARPVLIGPGRRGAPQPATTWLEGDSGRTVLLPPPAGMLLEFAVCSPWRDESGGLQVVGRLSGGRGNPWPGRVGLARVSFPEGRLTDFVATEAIPVSQPCWSRGPRPEVLFAAADGRLYRHAFGGDEAVARGRGHPGGSGEAPRRLDWHCPSPLAADVLLADPSRPPDPRFDRTLLVVLKPMAEPIRDAAPAGEQLWWLHLDGAGAAVIDAAPVLGPSALPGGRSLRSPVAGTTADGAMALAYLATDRPRAGRWDLLVAPLSFDDSGRPRVAAGPGRKLAGHCSTDLPPSFSSDGRHVRILRSEGGGHDRYLCVPLPARGVPGRDGGP